MENSPFSSSPQHERPVGSPLPSLAWVIIAAMVAATLFTIWTEPDLLPLSLSETLGQALTPDEEQLGDYPTPTPRPRPLVGIVAGHSGNDSGAVCPPELNNTREVDINLGVADRVRARLNEVGIDAVLLAEFDGRLNDFRGNALISIHADSCQYVNEEATGYKVAAAMSSSYPEQASRLTSCLRARYAEVTGMRFHAGSVTGDMTSYHAFDEINPLTPAAIIEIGFMNLDYEMLTKNQDKIAEGITNGILCFLRNETVSPEP